MVYEQNNNEFNQHNAYGTSFIEDTEIILWNGKTRKIQDIQRGDRIKCYDIKDLKKKQLGEIG